MTKKTSKEFNEEELDDLLKITDEDLATPVVEEVDSDEDDEEELLARLAAIRAKKARSGKTEEVGTNEPEKITIHFLEDGLTVLGNVWYRGQELTFEVGSPAYQATFDKNGKSWLLDYIDNPRGQVERWGGLKFARGPWPFLPWGVSLEHDERAVKEAEKAAKAEAQRNKIATVRASF